MSGLATIGTINSCSAEIHHNAICCHKSSSQANATRPKYFSSAPLPSLPLTPVTTLTHLSALGLLRDLCLSRACPSLALSALRLDNFDGPAVAEKAIEFSLYEEAFEIYKKFNKKVSGQDDLLVPCSAYDTF